jgi:hypothetical protein
MWACVGQGGGGERNRDRKKRRMTHLHVAAHAASFLGQEMKEKIRRSTSSAKWWEDRGAVERGSAIELSALTVETERVKRAGAGTEQKRAG